MNDLPIVVERILDYISKIMNPPYSEPMITALVAIVMILLMVLRWTRSRIKNTNSNEAFRSKVIEAIKYDRSLEKNLSEILGAYARTVTATGYFFYIYDDLDKCYVLTNTRIANQSEDIAPSYSGLLPFNKEQFRAPLNLVSDKAPKEISLFKEGDVTLLGIPVGKGKGLIAIGPMNRFYKLNKKRKAHFEASLKILDLSLLYMIENDVYKERIKTSDKKSHAMSSVQQSFSNYHDMLHAIMKISIDTGGATGGILMSFEENGNHKIPVGVGLENDIIESIRVDLDFSFEIQEKIDEKGWWIVSKEDDLYQDLPESLKKLDMGSLFFININYKSFQGDILIWYKEVQALEAYKVTAIRLMAQKIGEIMQNQMAYQGISKSYVSILKIIAQTLDNLTPYTIGRSELMYRYAHVIARQAGYSEEEIYDIALAAYLSNIGVVGLSDNLFLKSGKYTETEFEMMKYHSESGASIVDVTIGNKNISRYILEHHERVDGFGYPHRLKGSEISDGAKIIAIVQFFTAKIIGREDRDSLGFNFALEQIKAASGTQLDARLVDLLCKWFSDKRNNKEHYGKILGPCHEMRCSPESICQTCPAYKVTDKNCFEAPSNNCLAHGNRCETCFIKTEVYSRKTNA